MPQNSNSRSASTAARDKEANPAPGAKAPSFTLPRDGGGRVSLADFAGRKLVLYFYPRADTSSCNREAIDFSQLKAAFSRTGTEILGISCHGSGPPQIQAQAHDRARLRRTAQSSRRLRCAAAKIPVRPEIHGHGACHVLDRPGSADRTPMAESIGRRSRQRGSRSSQGAMKGATVKKRLPNTAKCPQNRSGVS